MNLSIGSPKAPLTDQKVPVMTIGVLSDTHIPDRVDRISPGLLDGFRRAGVDLIFHAGDICTPSVILSLEKIAPVKAVRGNRDMLTFRDLPLDLKMEIEGVTFVLTHGHGGAVSYLIDKFKYLLYGYSFSRYHQFLANRYPEARVIVYGHTHYAENRRIGGVLFFNPGSGTMPANHKNPSYGVIRVYPQGEVRGEICPLNGLDF